MDIVTATGEELSFSVFYAAGLGEAQAVTAWLDEGGGVDAHCAEGDGDTLLMAATFGGQEAMVRMLLQRGASVNLQNSAQRASTPPPPSSHAATTWASPHPAA